MLQAYSWPEATITVIPSDNRAPFVLGYAQGMSAARSFVRDCAGGFLRAKDRLTIDSIWVDDDALDFLQDAPLSSWLVEWNNSDGRTFNDRWDDVVINSVQRTGTLDDGVIRISVEAEGEPASE